MGGFDIVVIGSETGHDRIEVVGVDRVGESRQERLWVTL
jgi:hypothetical protein